MLFSGFSCGSWFLVVVDCVGFVSFGVWRFRYFSDWGMVSMDLLRLSFGCVGLVCFSVYCGLGLWVGCFCECDAWGLRLFVYSC